MTFCFSLAMEKGSAGKFVRMEDDEQLACYTAPGVVFASREELHAHYKSEWHRSGSLQPSCLMRAAVEARCQQPVVLLIGGSAALGGVWCSSRPPQSLHLRGYAQLGRSPRRS